MEQSGTVTRPLFIVHIDAMHDKAALTGTVEPGRGRRGKKIRGFQPVFLIAIYNIIKKNNLLFLITQIT